MQCTVLVNPRKKKLEFLFCDCYPFSCFLFPLKGRLYNSATPLVLVLTILPRLTISVACWQLPVISKNSAVSRSWNTSVMNQTFSSVLLLPFFPVRAFPFCLPLAAFIPSTRRYPLASWHSCASADDRLSCNPKLLTSHPPALSLPASGSLALWTEHSKKELLQNSWNEALRVCFKAILRCK